MGIADSVDAAFTAKRAAGLKLHRAWDRAATVMASAAPPGRLIPEVSSLSRAARRRGRNMLPENPARPSSSSGGG
jgi:hypothetical protein